MFLGAFWETFGKFLGKLWRYLWNVNNTNFMGKGVEERYIYGYSATLYALGSRRKDGCQNW